MLELKRQIFHALLGIILVFLVYYNFIWLNFLIILFLIGVVISYISSKKKILIVEWFLKNFDREEKIRGMGVLSYILGTIIVLALFEKSIAMASILILALGDSFCHIGKFGKLKFSFNKNKSIEGSVIGIIAATIGAMIFVPFFQAVLGSLIAMIVESFDVKMKNTRIDDKI